MDIAAKLAELRAKKAAEKTQAAEVTKIVEIPSVQTNSDSNVHSDPVDSVNTNTPVCAESLQVNLFNDAASRTQNIDHLEFFSKLNALQEAIHKQHPTMPVLLMQIHKQLKADPEIVTLLTEEAIGVVVKGLEIQTKTELVSQVVKQSKAKDKKTPLSADMF